jgi:cell division protein FtsN
MAFNNLRNFEFRLGRQGILLFVACMSLMLFLVFIIGVMVGMHIDAYPEKIARSIPQMILKKFDLSPGKAEKTAPVKELAKNPAAVDERNAAATVVAPAITKEEEPTGTEGVENKKTPPVASQPFPATLNAATGNQKTSPAITGEEGVKKPVDAGGGKEREAKPVPRDSTEPSSGRKPLAEGKYMLQVVSLKDKSKAEQFCKKITPLGYNPRVAMVELPKKGKWFRVVIDAFETRDEAKIAADALSEKIKGVNCVIRPVK